MAAKRTVCLWVVCGLLIILFFAGPVRGADLSPAQEQEFIDAKAALETARQARAEHYSAGSLKKAVEYLEMAESVRPLKDGALFTQASRLARVYAELAEAVAELKGGEEKLAATNDELRKIKAEIERLKKNP
jgi:hypothetical protein